MIDLDLIRKHFTAPFRYDERTMYIRDADDSIFCELCGVKCTTEAGHLIAQLLNEKLQQPADTCRRCGSESLMLVKEVHHTDGGKNNVFRCRECNHTFACPTCQNTTGGDYECI